MKKLVTIFIMSLFISTSLYAGIVFKIAAINPSEFQKQKVEVKSYLPPGTQAENVVDKGGLELSYDAEKELYFVYKEVELKPKESIIYRVELEDIWTIPEEELDILKLHTDALFSKLRRTEYVKVAGKLKKAIEKNLIAILKKQSASITPPTSPVEHISAYELNQVVLQTVKNDVGTLENLVILMGRDPGKIMGESAMGAKSIDEVLPGRGMKATRRKPTKERERQAAGKQLGIRGVELLAETVFKGKAPTEATTWRIIFIIIGFLALVSFIFFIGWWMQLKKTVEK